MNNKKILFRKVTEIIIKNLQHCLSVRQNVSADVFLEKILQKS